MSDTLATTAINKNVFFAKGSEDGNLSDDYVKEVLQSFLDSVGPRDDVLIIPPDYTRFHSQAGKLTRFVSEYYNFTSKEEDGKEGEDSTRTNDDKYKRLKSCHDPSSKSIVNVTAVNSENLDSTNDSASIKTNITILPALGTHVPMTQTQIKNMFGDKLAEKEPSPFIVHDWRNNVVTIGHVPNQMVREATGGMVDQPWPAQLNELVWEKRKNNGKNKTKHIPIVLSIGQVVPHEVMGMANFNKNLFVGVGGVEAINLSHFIGAVHGMEKMMGRASNPLRSILNYASTNFLQKELDLWYILTVMGTDPNTNELVMRGLYIGNDLECYTRACELSLKVNFTMLNKSPKKIVVYLDKDEYHSTWLGNKAIYRTRMAIADGGELIVLAPGVKRFGEDDIVDKLIRTYGYKGTPKTLKSMEDSDELKENLSAVAHLIHGSSEGRFSVTYCPGSCLSKEEVEGVGFQYADLETTMKKYNIIVENPTSTSPLTKDGWNKRKIIQKSNDESIDEEEEFFFISQPALGLWAVSSRFENENSNGKEESCATDSFVSVGSSMIPSPVEMHEQKPCNKSGGVGGWAKPPEI